MDQDWNEGDWAEYNGPDGMHRIGQVKKVYVEDGIVRLQFWYEDPTPGFGAFMGAGMLYCTKIDPPASFNG